MVDTNIYFYDETNAEKFDWKSKCVSSWTIIAFSFTR